MADGFTLIEVIVTIGIFSLLAGSAFLIGIPQYNQYILKTEKSLLIDTLLDCRTKSMTTGVICGIKEWGSGYCEINSTSTLPCTQNLYIVPSGITIFGLHFGVFNSDGLFHGSTSLSTSTLITICSNERKEEIRIDADGFIDGI